MRCNEIKDTSYGPEFTGGEIDDEKDIVICLNCGHLEHFHRDRLTNEIGDTCRKPTCFCQSFSPEICN